jgi:hypothetical protein
LLAYADAQYGLCQRTNELVEMVFAQISHGHRGFSLSREDDALGLAQLRRVVSQYGFNTQSGKRVNHRADVARIIFQYSYHLRSLAFRMDGCVETKTGWHFRERQPLLYSE